MPTEPTFAYIKINGRIMPMDRGDFYGDPLDEALQKKGWGTVTGGGTMQELNGEIEYCGLDVDLYHLDQSIPFICKFMNELGAPVGSQVEWSENGKDKTAPFGITQGLALYLNGTDLADDIYQTYSVHHVYSEINQLLDGIGRVQGCWQGHTETALYLYGPDLEAMKEAIADFVAEYPLCQKSRLEVIT